MHLESCPLSKHIRILRYVFYSLDLIPQLFSSDMERLDLGWSEAVDLELTFSSKSRFLISISCRILSTLMHSFSSADINALVCWISLRTNMHISPIFSASEPTAD